MNRYERVCISPVVGYSRDDLEKMVKNARKPDDLDEIEEYKPEYTAATHPHLAVYKDEFSKKDAKILKLH